MLIAPAVTPLASPVALPIVATVVLLLLQVPPASVCESVDTKPTQTTGVPRMVPVGFTVTVTVEKQVVGAV